MSDTQSAADLAQTLEALLEKSRESADRLAGLLQQGEHVLGALDRTPAEPPRDEAADVRLGELSLRAEQLETARAVAEAADRAKSCFLAAMSRELRTPVDGLARMIELLGQTDLDDEQKRYLRTANHSVCALLSLLDSVLSLSNVDAAIAELRTTDFDLRRTLDDTIELLRPLARSKGLRLKINVRSEVPPLLRGETGRLQQVLLYAVRRAVQLAAHGEISVRANVEETTDATTTVRFTIGHGDTEISREELNHAFAPKAHIDGPSATTRAGRGLGLTIARQLLELMGGRIEVEGNPNRGFAIWFTVPLDNYRQLADDRRAHGRLPQELLQCSLGPVLDLSMGGMRIHCSRAPKGEVDVELLDLEHPVSIRAEVMWARKIGFRKYEVGLNFPHVGPEVAKQLTRVSLNHRLRRLLGIS